VFVLNCPTYPVDTLSQRKYCIKWRVMAASIGGIDVEDGGGIDTVVAVVVVETEAGEV
jgi:hypothetical protein